METITTFPAEYQLTNHYVQAIVFPHALEGENADFFVNLKDGRAYSFTAFTPANIMEIMRCNDLHFLLSPGTLIVEKIDVETILSVVEACLAFEVRGGIPLDHYGILQR